jgi:GT2 family glycosyltransferase
MLNLCLKSLVENQTLDNQIIVVVDGDHGQNDEVLKSYPKVSALRFKDNGRESRAHNFGVYGATNEAVLILNDDNVASKEWDVRLLNHYHPNTVVTPNQIEPRPSIFQSFVHKDFGTNADNFQYDAFQTYAESISTPRISVDGRTFPFMFPKKMFMAVGGFDQLFPYPCMADWDLFLRWELLGVVFPRIFSTHFYHFSGAERTLQSMNTRMLEERESAKYFQYKWHFWPTLRSNNSCMPIDTPINGVDLL